MPPLKDEELKAPGDESRIGPKIAKFASDENIKAGFQDFIKLSEILQKLASTIITGVLTWRGPCPAHLGAAHPEPMDLGHRSLPRSRFLNYPSRASGCSCQGEAGAG